MTDEELMSRVKQDELEYLSHLFDKYHERLFSYFVRMTSDRTMSDDLVQNVFERVIKSRKTYKEMSSFQGWIFRIAKNTMTDHYRSLKTTTRKNIPVENLDLKEENFTQDDDLLESRKSKLLKAMTFLKEEHREILLLTRFENLEYKEAAGVIGLTENAVKARVFRALKSLKKIYFEKEH